MTIEDKTRPDVLRVTEFILQKGKAGQNFSICGAAKTTELNGIDEYRIAEIMRDICLHPNGPESMDTHTIIDGSYKHNLQAKWQLNATAYFSYLSYLSVKESEQANKTATRALWFAGISVVLTFFSIIFTAYNG